MKTSKWITAACLCMVAYLPSCSDSDGQARGGLSVRIDRTALPQDTEIGRTDLRLCPHKAGLPRQYLLDDASQLATALFMVEAGGWTAAVAANVRPPFALEENNQNADKLLLSVGYGKNEWSTPIYYGAGHTTVPDDDKVWVNVSLRPVLAQLSVTIEACPAGTTLNTTVPNAASTLHLTDGTPGDKACPAIFPPATAATDGRITTGARLLMPTIASAEHTLIELTVRTTEGVEMLTRVKVPVISSGGNYRLTLVYNEMKTDMTVGDVGVGDWTDGDQLDPNIADEEKKSINDE